MGDFMVLLGGYSHRHHQEDSSCFDGVLHFFHLPCLRWVGEDVLEHQPRGRQLPWGDGRGASEHRAVVAGRNGTRMFVTGGYRGAVSGEVIAYR